MRLTHTLLGSAFCALALLASPLQAKQAEAPVAGCKCDKKDEKCKCPEGACKCAGCKPAPAKPETAPEKAPCCPKEIADLQDHCGKCDKKDGDKPETCPDKAPCCPKEKPESK